MKLMSKKTNKYKKQFKADYRNFYHSDEWRKVRSEVLKAYGTICMKCHVLADQPHVDHVRPRSLFPKLALRFDNLQVLCKSCNRAKGQDIADYRKEIRKPKIEHSPIQRTRNWQFFDERKAEHLNGRSLSKDEIEKLGYFLAE